ncbi:MAG: hypothetical protein ACMZ64_06180 [Oleiphilus sp.]
MRKNDVVQCIQAIFLESCKELFTSLECEVSLLLSDDIHLEDCPIACIDGGSDDIEFMIALQLPLKVLALSYPVAEVITEVEDNRLEDWISELSNQLIGRLKAKLIEHDCYINIGLPQSYYGADVDALLDQNSQQADYYFDVDGEIGGCSISIEVFEEGMSFSIEPNQDIDIQEEGELELF